jgi:hypothetical protein
MNDYLGNEDSWQDVPDSTVVLTEAGSQKWIVAFAYYSLVRVVFETADEESDGQLSVTIS